MTTALRALLIGVVLASSSAFAQERGPVATPSHAAPSQVETPPSVGASSDAPVAVPGASSQGSGESVEEPIGGERAGDPPGPTRTFDGTEPAAAPVKLVVVGDRVSAELEGVERGAVLAAMAEQTDIEFVVIGDDTSSRVTASFDAAPLSEAIDVILAGAKSATVYVGKGEERRLTRVFVVIDSPSSASDADVPAEDDARDDDESGELAAAQPGIPDDIAPEVREALRTVQDQVATSDFLERLGEMPVEGNVEVPADVERQIEDLIRQRIPPEMLVPRSPDPPPTP